jgi:hypothetical protein
VAGILLAAICLFAAAAVAGIFLAFAILTQRKTPMGVALIHGVAGAAGLGCLALFVLPEEEPGRPGLSLLILTVNALLGFYLFSHHLRKRPWPKSLVVVHGLAAVTGVSLLLLTFFGF